MSRGLGDVYKRQVTFSMVFITACILYMVCRVDKDLEIPLAPYLLVGVGVVLFAEVLQ